MESSFQEQRLLEENQALRTENEHLRRENHALRHQLDKAKRIIAQLQVMVRKCS